jgi:acetyl-CoA carboxylase biotin carboxyl carrier protein
MASSDLAEMEFSQDGWTLRLVRHASTSPRVEPQRAPAVDTARDVAQPPALAQANVESTAAKELRAPRYGVVHLGPAPREPTFVTVGQAVKAGQTLASSRR